MISSFQFILKQLAPFKDFLYYLPTNPPTALPIEVKFETYEYKLFDDKIHIGHNLTSIKHTEIELLEPYKTEDFYAISVTFEQFISRLHNELCVPKNMLRLSMNAKEEDIKAISIPWTLKLSRQRKTAAN